MTYKKIQDGNKAYLKRALRLVVVGVAIVKIGNIKNYANKHQVCDFLDLFDDFKCLSKENKLELLDILNGQSILFYKVRLKDEWVFCD